MISNQEINGRTKLLHAFSEDYGKNIHPYKLIQHLEILRKRNMVIEKEDGRIKITPKGKALLERLDYCVKALEG